VWLSLLVLTAAAPAACAQDSRFAGPPLQGATAAYHSGEYEIALHLATRAVAEEPANAAAWRILAKIFLATGRYAEAESTLASFQASHPSDPSLWNLLGEVQYSRGRLAEAEQSFRKAVSGRASDSLTALLNLAVLRFERGEEDAALSEFDRFIDIYNTRRDRLSPSELAAVAEACRYLGRLDPQLFKDALRAYDEAIATDSTDLDRRVRLAELFLEKYNSTDAASTLRDVLAVNPKHARALLAMARVRYFDGESDAERYLARSLAVDSVNPGAHALAATLLADAELYAEAAERAMRGLVADSGAPEALAVLAAARYLMGDSVGSREALARVHARRPRSGDAEVVLAGMAARARLYAEAVAFAEAAVRRDPRNARARALLGINALRVGDIQRGREELEAAFALDPYDVWAKNTLDLLDTFKDYREIRAGRFLFVIESKDAELLSLYATPLAEEAYDSLASRYGYRPATPIRVEFFRSHADFSVRTVGLAGLGALGVSFGRVVAMNSPAGRRPGEFNWGSTLWHELAHVFTLEMSGHRVPRWFSEGLSVYEERRARRGWGDDPSPLFIAAYAAGKLPPLSRLNDGFMRPSYPEQVVLSYYLASLACEMIEREFGLDAIKAMLRGYRAGKTTEQLFREVLRSDQSALDRRFDDWLRHRFARELQAVRPRSASEDRTGGVGGIGIAIEGPYVEAMRKAAELVREERFDEAIPILERAKAMFPEYAGEDSPYALLARSYSSKGDLRRAAAELAARVGIDEEAYDAHLDLARTLATLGDSAGAADALDRAMWIYPFHLADHETLAALARAAGQHDVHVRERRAVLALDPADRAEALYQLASAYLLAGDPAAARREVLRALEIAPNFERAQELLLRLRAGRPPGGN
jgi:tetratricopeptide (TPR) repeat protein